MGLFDKTREKIISTLREEDDEDMESSDYTLKQEIDKFCALLFGYEVKKNEVHEPKIIDGKRVIGIYNDELQGFVNPNLNCVFEKIEDPADGMDPGINNIIKLDDYRNSQNQGVRKN